MRHELTERWYPAALNRTRGGFHQNFARDWTRLPDYDGAFVVYQARMTWTAARFSEYAAEHREPFVDYTRHGVAFLDGPMRDRQHGGFHWRIDANGRGDSEKHTYGLAFVIYAGSVAHRLTGDPVALKVARDAFDWTDAHAHDATHGGYFEALQPDGTPIEAPPPDARPPNASTASASSTASSP